MPDCLAQQVVRGWLDRRNFFGRVVALGRPSAVASTLLHITICAAGLKQGSAICVGLQGGSTSASLEPALATNSTDQQVMRLWGDPSVELTADGSLEGRLAEEWSVNDHNAHAFERPR